MKAASLAAEMVEMTAVNLVEMTAANLVEVTADMMARMMARMMDWLSAGLKAQPKVEMLVVSLAEETADMKEWRLDLQLVEVPCIHMQAPLYQALPWERGRHLR